MEVRDTAKYRNTLILVSEDCPVSAGVEPAPGTVKPSVARIQYALIAGHPYEYTQDDILFETHLQQSGSSVPDDQKAALWNSFFDRPRPCLRTSPLVKKYGWGLHFDSAGRVALFGRDTPRYKQLTADARVEKKRGMRSARPKA